MSNQFAKSTLAKPSRSITKEDTLESLPIYLARLYHGFVALVDRLRGEDADDLPHFRPGAGSVYFALLQQEDCTATELAARLRMPKPTITGLLDGLERDGVIERRPCAEDGRAMRLRLTTFGRRLEPGMHRRHELAVRTLEEWLSRAEAAELRRLLTVVAGNLDRVRGVGAKQPRESASRVPRRTKRAA
ncbi:MAG TPA: MarR family winged helix-turn-helix transcriptional regulator [Candidatus Saccharimonadia bacterium]|nr:MarR family winged helix-turn-helix transcriptional regulator [Candidatus Saccharimonadia bacterium]